MYHLMTLAETKVISEKPWLTPRKRRANDAFCVYLDYIHRKKVTSKDIKDYLHLPVFVIMVIERKKQSI